MDLYNRVSSKRFMQMFIDFIGLSRDLLCFNRVFNEF